MKTGDPRMAKFDILSYHSTRKVRIDPFHVGDQLMDGKVHLEICEFFDALQKLLILHANFWLQAEILKVIALTF